jgi:hypothetical protein
MLTAVQVNPSAALTPPVTAREETNMPATPIVPLREALGRLVPGCRLKSAVLSAALALTACAASSDFNTLASGGEFRPQDCGSSPVSGLAFQRCMETPWLMGSGHASSGGYAAFPYGPRPGSEGGLVDSEKIYAASLSNGAGVIMVEYAIPRSSTGSFYETTPLNNASLVSPECLSILEKPCKTGSPIADLTVREVEINGRPARLEEFSILNNPAFHSGFVAYFQGEHAPSRPGYQTSAVVRGFLAQPAVGADAVVSLYLSPLRFQRFALSSL